MSCCVMSIVNPVSGLRRGLARRSPFFLSARFWGVFEDYPLEQIQLLRKYIYKTKQAAIACFVVERVTRIPACLRE